jgi:hypothetical protein
LCTVYLYIKEKEKGINKCMWTATRAIFPYGGALSLIQPSLNPDSQQWISFKKNYISQT